MNQNRKLRDFWKETLASVFDAHYACHHWKDENEFAPRTDSAGEFVLSGESQRRVVNARRTWRRASAFQRTLVSTFGSRLTTTPEAGPAGDAVRFAAVIRDAWGEERVADFLGHFVLTTKRRPSGSLRGSVAAAVDGSPSRFTVWNNVEATSQQKGRRIGVHSSSRRGEERGDLHACRCAFRRTGDGFASGKTRGKADKGRFRFCIRLSWQL